MMKKAFSLLAGGALLALASTAYAGQPLTNQQLDRVTAGGTALADAAALALGEVDSITVTQTSTNVSTVTPKIAVGQSFAQALAAGGFLFDAAAAVHSDSFATLP